MTEHKVIEGRDALLWPDEDIPANEREQRLLTLRRLVVVRNAELVRELGLREAPIRLVESGAPTVRVTGIAGSLVLGDVQLEIAPKYLATGKDPSKWQSSLVAIMEFASRRRVAFTTAQTADTAALRFADRLAFTYAEALRRSRTGAPIREYRRIEEVGRGLRGRLRVTDQLRLSLRRPELVAYERSELHTDNVYNSLLRYSVRRLSASVRDARVRRQLEAELALLPAAPDASPPSRLPGRAPRQYAHYDEALSLANYIVLGNGITRGERNQPGADFVVGTEKLFESFLEQRVHYLCRRRSDWVAESQSQSEFAVSLSGKRSYFSKPDNLITTTTSGAGLVIDAKYKRFGDAVQSTPGRPGNADVYQMVAACVAHDRDRALLLYPTPVTGEPVDSDSPSEEVDAAPIWWKTQLSPKKHVYVGAACVNVNMVTDASSLATFEANLERLIESAMSTPLA